jgi:tetratricopeptide (TPR) repeat protein
MSSIKAQTEALFFSFLSFLFIFLLSGSVFADIDEWKATFQLAESVINTKSERDAIPIFRKMIGEISAERAKRPLLPEETALLAKGLDHLAQAFFNSNEMSKANETFLQLIDVDPNYQLNEDLVSPKIIQMYDQIKHQMLGTLSVQPTPKDAVVELDSIRIASGEAPIYVKQGDHVLKVSKPGYEPSTQTVTITAGAKKDVAVELKSFSDAVAVLLSDRPEALQAYQDAMQSADKSKIAAALEQAGDAVYEQKKITEAQDIYERALNSAREAGDNAVAAQVLMDLGDVSQAQKDYVTAQSRYAEALASFQQMNNKDASITAMLRLGDLQQLQNHPADATKNYEAAVAMLKEKGDKAATAATLLKLGNLKRAAKDSDARTNYQEALALFKELNDTASAAQVQTSLDDLRTDDKYKVVMLLNQATALLNQGSYSEAERKFTEALDLARQIDAKDNASSALLSLGYIMSGQGRHADAIGARSG